jgi:electron-transferring-flavoprotein dehydrogenase
LVEGLAGMALTGLTRGLLSMPGEPLPSNAHLEPFDKYYKGKITTEEVARIRQECLASGTSVHETLMERSGWPPVEFDGKILVSHQDALLIGGKVQAPAGYADHVVFLYPNLCETCGTRICVEICSGEAITMTPLGQPQFDRDKCVHCGACVWNCSQTLPGEPERTNIEFRAGTGGLHSTEN